MKIAFYINSLAGGGAERVVSVLAGGLAKAHEVTVINSYPVPDEYKLDEDVRHLYLEEQKSADGFLRRNIRRISRLRKVLKNERTDVLVSFMAEPNFRAIVATKGLKCRTVVSVRNAPEKEYPDGFRRFLAKILYRKADGIVFQTEDAKNWFPKAIRHRSEIIFNPVDDAFYRVTPDSGRHNIVTVGRLTEQKNHKMLIRAFAWIADRVQDNLIIYGDGKLRGQLEELIAELHMEKRVFLPGSIKNVADTIKSAKLFVLSSDYEGMPNSLMEAMALGLPCIATDCPCGGPKTLLGDESSMLVEVGDEVGLTDLMLRCLSDAQFRDRQGALAKVAASAYRSDVIIREWDAYLRLITRTNSEKRENDHE